MTNNLVGVEKKAVAPFFKNGYLVFCKSTRQAFYIDPGEEAPELLRRVRAEQLTLISIINTHAHVDHICGIERVKKEWDIPVYLHPDDQFLYDALPEQAQWFGLEYTAAPPVDQPLHEGQRLKLGDLNVKIHHTPGHSPGGVCLELEEYVFCGDCIFAGSIGRTDLPGGSLTTLMNSIRQVILPLGDNKILCPGHGPETTISQERNTNPFLI